MKQRIIYSLWISFGFLLNQFFHAFAYREGNAVTGFPSIRISFTLAIILSFVLFFLGFLLFWGFYRKISDKPVLIIIPFLILEIVAQIFSVSIIKFGFESVIVIILFFRIQIEKNYSLNSIEKKDPRIISIIHNEVLSFLRISVSIFIFMFSVIGISLAVQFLQKYYGVHFFSRIMLWYGILTLYSVIGFLLLISYYLYNKMVAIRDILEKRMVNDNECS